MAAVLLRCEGQRTGHERASALRGGPKRKTGRNVGSPFQLVPVPSGEGLRASRPPAGSTRSFCAAASSQRSSFSGNEFGVSCSRERVYCRSVQPCPAVRASVVTALPPPAQRTVLYALPPPPRAGTASPSSPFTPLPGRAQPHAAPLSSSLLQHSPSAPSCLAALSTSSRRPSTRASASSASALSSSAARGGTSAVRAERGERSARRKVRLRRTAEGSGEEANGVVEARRVVERLSSRRGRDSAALARPAMGEVGSVRARCDRRVLMSSAAVGVSLALCRRSRDSEPLSDAQVDCRAGGCQ